MELRNEGQGAVSATSAPTAADEDPISDAFPTTAARMPTAYLIPRLRWQQAMHTLNACLSVDVGWNTHDAHRRCHPSLLQLLALFRTITRTLSTSAPVGSDV